MFTIIDVDQIVKDQNGDKRVIPYLIKLELLQKQFNIDINYKDIENQSFESDLCYCKLTDRFYAVFQE